jgi:hypothetical protein
MCERERRGASLGPGDIGKKDLEFRGLESVMPLPTLSKYNSGYLIILLRFALECYSTLQMNQIQVS